MTIFFGVFQQTWPETVFPVKMLKINAISGEKFRPKNNFFVSAHKPKKRCFPTYREEKLASCLGRPFSTRAPPRSVKKKTALLGFFLTDLGGEKGRPRYEITIIHLCARGHLSMGATYENTLPSFRFVQTACWNPYLCTFKITSIS